MGRLTRCRQNYLCLRHPDAQSDVSATPARPLVDSVAEYRLMALHHLQRHSDPAAGPADVRGVETVEAS